MYSGSISSAGFRSGRWAASITPGGTAGGCGGQAAVAALALLAGVLAEYLRGVSVARAARLQRRALAVGPAIIPTGQHWVIGHGDAGMGAPAGSSGLGKLLALAIEADVFPNLHCACWE